MSFISWIKGLFSNVVKVFKKFTEKIADIAIAEGAAYILDVARNTITELAKTNLSNDKKRKEAFKKISKYAEDEGLDIPNRIINKVIEDCVIEFKAEF